MPELPEVETTRRGIEPHCKGAVVHRLIVREGRLRWPVPGELPELLAGRKIEALERRAKYLIFNTGDGALLVHLGMSGSLRVVDPGQVPGRHDHIDILLRTGVCLRYHDPRRFGSFLWREPGSNTRCCGIWGPSPCRRNSMAHCSIAARAAAGVLSKTLSWTQKWLSGLVIFTQTKCCFLPVSGPTGLPGEYRWLATRCWPKI